MSKVSFRARALDATKPLPIFHATDIPDISDYSAINRTVPQMPTGMEKEEETERHLQEVLSQPVNKKNQAFIPTPEAAIAVPHYSETYGRYFEKPHLYIRVPGLGLEEEIPDYDLDEEDEEWLSAQTKERPLSPSHFERMMDKLEKGSGNTVLSVRDAQLLLKDDEDLVLAVYDYWLAKRLRLGRALIPTVKHERRDGTASNSPYLAFRKRTEKMQTRKNRKNDEQAYMQMLKLKRDLARVSPLMELMKDRENKKLQLSQAQQDIFKKRYLLEDWSGGIMSSLRPVATKSATSRQSSMTADQWDRTVLIKMESLEEDDVHQVGRHEVLVSSGLKKKRKKKYYYATTPEPEPVIPATPEKPIKEPIKDVSAEKSDDEEPDGMFTFKRKAHVKYFNSRSRLGVWPWYGSDVDEREEGLSEGMEGMSQKKYRFSKATFSERFIGRARRRKGRGGRALWDRIVFSDSEDETLPTVPPPSQVEGASLDTSQCSTEDENTVKSFHFLTRSPSPSSNFEFQHFSLIEQPSSEGAPYHHQGAINVAFGGFASDSEFQDEASSFSTLPTSQFALKPSSSDVECDTGDWGSDSMDWNWTEPVRLNSSEESGTNSQELHQRNFKRTTKVDQSLTADKSLRTNTHLSLANVPVNTRRNAQKQVEQVEQPKQPADKSRSSLSVTDSKTIVLSNSSPANSQPPASKSGSSSSNSSVPKASETLRPSVVTEATTAAESKNRDKSLPNGPTAESVTATSTAKVDKEKTADVWSMNGPATIVKQLNFPPKRPRENASTTRKCLFATVDAALLITSQFQLQRKREENLISLPAQPPTTIIASGPPQPKIVNASRDMHSALINPPVKIGPLPGILQSGSPAISAPNNPPVKIDSLPGVLEQRRISMPAIRRASTNGNNYPDILQSATRRLSETERGLKQALAGSVINHSSLIETTTNSLVPLGNTSEVT